MLLAVSRSHLFRSATQPVGTACRCLIVSSIETGVTHIRHSNYAEGEIRTWGSEYRHAEIPPGVDASV